MSPEQIGARPGEVDARTDVYSLGATLYELITGQPLYEGLKTRQQIIAHMFRKPARRPRQIDDRIPVDLETICLKALEFDPAGRYQSAAAMADDLHRYLNHKVIQARHVGPIKRCTKLIARHKAVSALIVVAVIAASAAASIAWQNARSRKFHRLLPTLQQYVGENRYFPAYRLARELEALAPDDPGLADAWSKITHNHTLVTTPTSARIRFQDYFDPDSPWISLGPTPIASIDLPYGVNRFRVTADGYLPLEVAILNRKRLPDQATAEENAKQRHIAWVLHRPDQIPPDMLWIPGVELSQRYMFHSNRIIANSEPFLIDKYEVTNREFKAFVDSDGYDNSAFWQEPFVKDGVTLTWEFAQQQFVDQSGRPGPSTWRNAEYPPGQGNYPVSGLSWFEAAAYARFVGKNLPTAYHWILASSAEKVRAKVSVFSNYSGKPSPVGVYRGMSQYGLYDAAGNVREWCYNTVAGKSGQRCILGGAYDSPHYLPQTGFFTSPWDRSAYNGVRCVQYIRGKDRVPAEAFTPMEFFEREWDNFNAVSPETYEDYWQTLFSYDHKPLQAMIESVDDEMDLCRRERVTFDAAYPNDRVIMYLHLPMNAQPPYQAVLWYPGAEEGGKDWEEYSQSYESWLLAVLKGGRALVVPFYKDTYERSLENSLWTPFGLQDRNLAIQQAQDLARTIDYLETREDIDPNSLAYLGRGWGATIGSRVLAYETRIKAAVFLYGGFCPCTEKCHPSVDPARFLPYVKIPVLMINGRDSVCQPFEAAQKPLYDLLGTSEEHKKLMLHPGGHTIPWAYREQQHRAISDWYDQYLGLVETTDP